MTRPLLLVLLTLALTVSVPAQEWKLIKEMSGDIQNHPGFRIEVYAARIARGDDKVKLTLRFDFPNGAPFELFRKNVPFGFDVSSIARITSEVKLNCKTLTVSAVKNSAEIHQINGNKLKSKEPPVKLDSGSVFAGYFCEGSSEKSTGKPVLKTK
jgi:hypothetical protein